MSGRGARLETLRLPNRKAWGDGVHLEAAVAHAGGGACHQAAARHQLVHADCLEHSAQRLRAAIKATRWRWLESSFLDSSPKHAHICSDPRSNP